MAASPVSGGAERPVWGLEAVVGKTVRDFFRDDIPGVAAGVTFYCLLALFPALSAMMSLYGLFADVGEVRGHILALRGLAPAGAVTILGDELRRLASSEHGGLSLTFAVSLALSLWSANAGMRALLKGLTIAYETRERRGPIVLHLTAMAFTGAGIILCALVLSVIGSVPALLARLEIDISSRVDLLKWPLLVAALVGGIYFLYAFGPDLRGRPRVKLPGACASAVGWTAMSLGFSWYVSNFGHFDRTFGALGAVAGFMTWMWLSTMVVLFGAELNAAIVAHDPPPPAAG